MMMKMMYVLFLFVVITNTLGHSFGENSTWDDYDEDYDIKPISYVIRIIPNLENFTYKGNITIKVTAKGEVENITLYSTDLNVTGQSVMDSEGGKEYFDSAKQEDEHFHILMLNEKTKNNSIYTIKMRFEGKLRDDMFGFYRSSYTGKDNTTEWMASTNFEQTSASDAFPCFDEPQLKATFTISLARPSNMNTLCNMPLMGPGEEDPSLPKGYVWDNYMESPKMPTYLVAFTVSKFHQINSSFTSLDNKTKPFTVWAPENTIDQVMFGLEVGPRILEIMQNLTDFDYILPKIDLIAIPDFYPGFIKNWGLVTLSKAYFLNKEGDTSAESRQLVATAIAYALAQQWFGDVVSPEWLENIWLNEGFATYFMYKATSELHPKWRLMEQFVVDILQTAFLLDVQDEANPIIDVNIFAVFDNIIYNKAGSLNRMMEHLLGKEVFFKGLWNYLDTRKYNSGNEDQLFEGLNRAAAEKNVKLPNNLTMKDIMYAWAHQVGVPLLTIVRNFTDGTALIRQERFMAPKANETWTIPLTFTTQASPNFDDTAPNNWIMENQTEKLLADLPLGNEWIIFNIQVTGYYRVNYDDENWNLITEYLNSENHINIHVLNKAQLISDSLYLAKAGYLNYNHALDLTSYLERETDFIPWSSAYIPFDFISSRIGNSSALEKYNLHMQVLLKKAYDSLKLNDTSNKDHVESLTISKVMPWACKYKYEKCITMAKQLFEDFLENDTSVPVNLKEAVYCNGISEGSVAEWNKLWEIAASTNISSEKVLILNALGCTKSDELIEGYLNKTLLDDGQVRKQDRTLVFKSVLATAEGLNVGINFLIENFEQMRAGYGNRETEDILLVIASQISSQVQIDQVTTFVISHKKTFGNNLVLEALKTMHSNNQWNKKYGKIIEDWLNERYPSSSTGNKAIVLMVGLATLISYYL